MHEDFTAQCFYYELKNISVGSTVCIGVHFGVGAIADEGFRGIEIEV